jgi:hypothetical protein
MTLLFVEGGGGGWEGGGFGKAPLGNTSLFCSIRESSPSQGNVGGGRKPWLHRRSSFWNGHSKVHDITPKEARQSLPPQKESLLESV